MGSQRVRHDWAMFSLFHECNIICLTSGLLLNICIVFIFFLYFNQLWKEHPGVSVFALCVSKRGTATSKNILHCHLLIVLSHSVLSDSFVTPWTITSQAPLSMGFSRQEYWSGLPCLPPKDLPNSGTEPKSLALAGGFFTIEPLSPGI